MLNDGMWEAPDIGGSRGYEWTRAAGSDMVAWCLRPLWVLEGVLSTDDLLGIDMMNSDVNEEGT